MYTVCGCVDVVQAMVVACVSPLFFVLMRRAMKFYSKHVESSVLEAAGLAMTHELYGQGDWTEDGEESEGDNEIDDESEVDTTYSEGEGSAGDVDSDDAMLAALVGQVAFLSDKAPPQATGSGYTSGSRSVAAPSSRDDDSGSDDEEDEVASTKSDGRLPGGYNEDGYEADTMRCVLQLLESSCHGDEDDRQKILDQEIIDKAVMVDAKQYLRTHLDDSHTTLELYKCMTEFMAMLHMFYIHWEMSGEEQAVLDAVLRDNFDAITCLLEDEDEDEDVTAGA